MRFTDNELIQCPHCDGTGVRTDPEADDPADRQWTCVECEGEGELEVSDHDLAADRAEESDFSYFDHFMDQVTS